MHPRRETGISRHDILDDCRRHAVIPAANKFISNIRVYSVLDDTHTFECDSTPDNLSNFLSQIIHLVQVTHQYHRTLLIIRTIILRRGFHQFRPLEKNGFLYLDVRAFAVKWPYPPIPRSISGRRSRRRRSRRRIFEVFILESSREKLYFGNIKIIARRAMISRSINLRRYFRRLVMKMV